MRNYILPITLEGRKEGRKEDKGKEEKISQEFHYLDKQKQTW